MNMTCGKLLLGAGPTSTKMTLITFLITLISILLAHFPLSTVGGVLESYKSDDGGVGSSNSLSSHHFHLERKSCKTSLNCGNPNKECIDGLCFCKPQFDDVLTHSGGEDDGCMRSYGNSCNVSLHCNVYKNLACDDKRDGTCVCHKHDEDHDKEESPLVYDEILEKCVALPGGKCDLKVFAGVGIGCVPKADCVPDPERTVDRDYYGICECVKGFAITGDGRRCVPGVGSKCEIDADCDDPDNGGLECHEGRCRCQEDRLHDQNSNRCRLKVGFDCESEQDNCMDGTRCILKSGEDSNKKYKWGWECSCEDGRLFDHERGHCSIKVGGDCEKYVANRCVIHAFCGTGKKCQCFEGYDRTENGTCVKPAVVEEMEPELVQNDQAKPTSSGTSSDPGQPIGDPEFIRSSSSSSILIMDKVTFVLALFLLFYSII